MRITIEELRDPGVPNRERLVLRLITDADLAGFLVLSSFQGMPEHVLAGGLPSYWFPSRDAEVGDRIILYTGSGELYEEENDEGGTDFVFYWGRKTTLWGADEAVAVVLEVTSWTSTSAEGKRVETAG